MFTVSSHNLAEVSETLELSERELVKYIYPRWDRQLYRQELRQRKNGIKVDFSSEGTIATISDEIEAIKPYKNFGNFSKVEIMFNTILMIVFTVIAAMLALIFSPSTIIKTYPVNTKK